MQNSEKFLLKCLQDSKRFRTFAADKDKTRKQIWIQSAVRQLNWTIEYVRLRNSRNMEKKLRTMLRNFSTAVTKASVTLITRNDYPVPQHSDKDCLFVFPYHYADVSLVMSQTSFLCGTQYWIRNETELSFQCFKC